MKLKLTDTIIKKSPNLSTTLLNSEKLNFSAGDLDVAFISSDLYSGNYEIRINETFPWGSNIGYIYHGHILDRGQPTVTSKAGIDLIKEFEGLRLTAYKCPASVWTIGFGNTSRAYPGLTISELDAERFLKEDLRVYEKGVHELVHVDITQSQFDALVSFAFNLGVAALRTSTLMVKLNSGDVLGAANEFPKWVWAAGQKLPGLVRRRDAERMLFTTKG